MERLGAPLSIERHDTAVSPETPPPATSAEELRRRIEADRERLDATIDELQDRLAPKALARDAGRALGRKAQRGARSLVARARSSPRATAAVAAGVLALGALVVWRRRRG